MHTRWKRPLVVAFALALVAAGCSDGDDNGGAADGDLTAVTIFGPEVESELEGFATALEPLKDQGIEASISGDRSAEEQIGVQVSGGSAPDIFVFPQPGRVQDFIESGDLVPLRQDVADAVRESFPEDLWRLGEGPDGELYAVPNKADVKSLVWYSPTAFTDAGYDIPATHDELIELADTMVTDGERSPFCIGIGSDAATGWPFTDWVEDYMLRLKGPDVYDAWVANEIPFDDPDVIEVGEFVFDLWSTPDYVFGGLQTIASTPFADSGLGVIEENCWMHRQANFFEAQWPSDVEVGPEADVWAFYLPPVTEEFGNPVLSAGTLLAAFNDDDAVMDALLYMAGTEYVELRANAQVGFLSPNTDVDASVYPNEAAAVFLEILSNADVVRFDASDLMPGVVGSGSFWEAAVDITTEAKTVAEAFATVEGTWPS